ncbi:hypothetical protein B0T10DRAFT_483702 [Thelonectria olida]|uniref:Uncharacterized protein n=1 Tax=Thelonectria olida TaxID=1576542 RepID=A0A9P8WAF4_9HYPO|nr:hypothetical protein B0T10DRAFT_483702 [Thelonectria olida]
MPSSLVTSLLVPDIFDPQTLVAQVLKAEPTATAYLLNCPDGTDSNDCGTYNMSITLGPWASKTPPAGAPKTGAFDLFVGYDDPADPWTFSLHCDVSKTVGEECTTINVGGNNDGHPTATFTSPDDLEDQGLATFVYFPVTITAGLDLIASASATATADNSAQSSASVDATSANSEASGTETAGAETSGTASSSSASTPEATSGATSRFNYLLAAMSVAGIATACVLL